MSMNAITTKYHGPANVRGSRISATCAAGRVVVGYDDELSQLENHERAALALKTKLKWTERVHGSLHSGRLANGDYVWVMVEDTPMSYPARTSADAVPLLRRAVAALNTAPRFKVPSLDTDSYEIAAEIDALLRAVDNFVVESVIRAHYASEGETKNG